MLPALSASSPRYDMPVRALFEDHRDLADHLLEPAADPAQSRFGVDLLVVERRPALLKRLADGGDRSLTVERIRQISVASSTLSRASSDHSMRAANAPPRRRLSREPARPRRGSLGCNKAG